MTDTIIIPNFQMRKLRPQITQLAIGRFESLTQKLQPYQLQRINALAFPPG